MKLKALLLVALLAVVGCDKNESYTVVTCPNCRTDIDALKVVQALTTTNVQLIDTRVTVLEGKVAQLEQDVINIQTTIINNGAAYVAAILALQAKDVSLSADLATALNKILALEGHSVVVDAQIAALQASLASIATRVTAVEGVGSANAALIASLQTTVAGLGTSVSANTAAITVIQSSVAGITTNVTNLTNQLNALPNLSGYAALLAQVQGLTTSVSGLTTTVAGHTTSIATINANVAAAATNIASLQATVAGMQGKLVEIVNTCSNEKFQRINGKLYGVYFNSSNAQVVTNSTCSVLGLLGNAVCIGLNQTKIDMKNVTGVYYGEIPNGTYTTTTGAGNDCTFTVNNGQVQ